MSDQPTAEWVSDLFVSMMWGSTDDFLARCSDDLVLHARGTHAATTYVPKPEIPAWYESLKSLAGSAMRSTIEVVRLDESKVIVLLRHTFVRDGIDHDFEMVNDCRFRGTTLTRWSSYPLNLPTFARALGVEGAVTPQLV